MRNSIGGNNQSDRLIVSINKQINKIMAQGSQDGSTCKGMYWSAH